VDTPLTVQRVYEDLSKRLGLEWLAGQNGAHRSFTSPATSPGAPSVVGHFNLIHANQAQVLGRPELDYLAQLKKNSYKDACEQLFKSGSVAIFITDGEHPPERFRELAEHYALPILRTPLSSNELINHLRYYFAHKLAERVHLHGVFLEVLSTGVLLTGDSGVGKSELALELITRGHRLIADDAPEFARIAPDVINGTCPPLLQDFLEVRGLGVLNIRAMYGDSVIKTGKYLRLIVHLQRYDPTRQDAAEDRLQHLQKTRNVLGVEIPEFTLPVAPGRNLAVLVEAAVRNHLLRLNGYNAAEDLAARQRRALN